MPRRSRRSASPGPEQVVEYRHTARRLNNPPAGLVSADYAVRETPRTRYAYDPHLSPQLVWAGKTGLKAIEVEDEAGVEADDVALHVHERVSTRAIVEAVRRPEPKQLDLFADPQLPLDEALRWYQHDIDWTNRLILGDSLLVMNSLLTQEQMRGKVQMIYADPPYGVNYKSNFQPRIDQRDVKEDDSGLTREPEQIRAYRDTWTLGVHSYLNYLRDRLRLCRDLLSERGSIFVQIGDDNVHRVRLLLDEIFGADNFCSLISMAKTSAQTSRLMPSVADFILWYAYDLQSIKYRPLFDTKAAGEVGAGKYRSAELADGRRLPISAILKNSEDELPNGARVFRVDNLTSSREGRPHGPGTSGNFPVTIDGSTITPPASIAWKTNEAGMARLIAAERVVLSRDSLGYMRYIDDFPAFARGNIWTDIGGIQSRADPKVYVVQTSASAIQRCILMTTDPGDLVLDPTCGSGTTAYVAEQWGRRWIACDTSRVALALARQRLLTASFPFYELADDQRGVDSGFVYRTVPHIQLSDYARNTRIDPIVERYTPPIEQAEAAGDQDEVKRLTRARREEIDRVVAEDSEQETLHDQPKVERGVTRVSGPFTVEAIPPAVLDVQAETPILGAPESADGAEIALAGRNGPAVAVDEASAHIPRLIADLARDGVTFPDNRILHFKSLTPRTGVLHAEGEAADEADLARVAVSFGPLNGAVSMGQIEDALYEARRGGYDAVIFCGFSFQAEAQAFLSEARAHQRVRAFMAHIRPDVVLTDARGESLLKTQAASQLFAVFGEPDVELSESDADGAYTVTLRGVDVYDPLTGRVDSAPTRQIAAWFVDTDYDGRTFCICQAFFPNVDAWSKIARALRGRLDETRLEKLSGSTSLPFLRGRHGRVAVKVIDQRGNEVMRLLSLQPAGELASAVGSAE